MKILGQIKFYLLKFQKIVFYNLCNNIFAFLVCLLWKDFAWEGFAISYRGYYITWLSKDEIVSDVLLWTPAYGQSKAGRLARTFIQQLCDDTGCNPEDLPEAMNDRETWRERVRDIRASRTSWWWWLSYITVSLLYIRGVLLLLYIAVLSKCMY